MKKILVVYPHNLFTEKSGINTRYVQLLKYFKSRGLKVDVLTLKHFRSSWADYPPDKDGLVDELFFYDFKKGARWQRFKNRKQNPMAWLRKKIPFCYAYTHLPNFAYNSMKKQFGKILKQHSYDFILISYVYWAGLIDIPAAQSCTTLLDLSDFSTLNRFDRTDGDVRIGSLVHEEIRRVEQFDKVLCISDQEKWFFSQFARTPHYYYVPFFMPLFMENSHASISAPPKYDILFIGSDNPHNQKGIQWFLHEILPRLTKPYKILIVGSICNHINPNTPVTLLPEAENLAHIYPQTKVTICPLSGGTGMKIKVVESLSFGRPVVTTSKGLTGFPTQIGAGCAVADDAQNFALNLQKILHSDRLYNSLSQEAINFFKRHFEASAVYTQLDEIFSVNQSVSM